MNWIEKVSGRGEKYRRDFFYHGKTWNDNKYLTEKAKQTSKQTSTENFVMNSTDNCSTCKFETKSLPVECEGTL